MNIITLSSEEFDDFSKKHKYNSFYQSSDYAKFMHDTEGFDSHYLGFVDENNNLIGASLMLYKTLFWGYKYTYAPRGLLIDYDDTALVTEVTNALKRLLKKQKFIFIKIDPPIIASERDKDGNTLKFNNGVNRILNCFKKNNYEHLGFNLYNESILSRWNVIARLHTDGRVIFNNFTSDVKEKISYANNMSLTVYEDTNLDIDKFYNFIKAENLKKSKKYFQVLINTFKNSNRVKIFYANLNTNKYTQNANNLYAKEEEHNRELANIIQSGDTIKYDIQKAINDKIASDKNLSVYKKDIVLATKLLKEHPAGIDCGVALVIEDASGVNILLNHEANNYSRYNVEELLNYEIMKYYGKLNYKYINLGSVSGNFNANSKFYPMLLSKIGFNSSILEYIGEFNIILKPTLYNIYKKKYKK